MYLAGTIEQAGTGTEEIVKKCLAYGLRQPEFIQEDGFTTVVWRKEASNVKEVMEDGGLNVPKNVPNYDEKIDNSIENELGNELETSLVERERQIIQSVKKNSYITQKELGKIIGITPQNIRVYISKLKQKGLLVRVGPDKGGHWEITGQTGETKPAMSGKSTTDN